MRFEIRTLIKIDDTYCEIGDLPLNRVDEDYLEGAILWSIDQTPILTRAEWDLVDQLWVYLIRGAKALLDDRYFESYFPDQPLKLRLKAINMHFVEFYAGDRRVVVDRAVFFESLCVGASEFFDEVRQKLPSCDELARAQLTLVADIRRSIGLST